jgi:hypothetical protein
MDKLMADSQRDLRSWSPSKVADMAIPKESPKIKIAGI